MQRIVKHSPFICASHGRMQSRERKYQMDGLAMMKVFIAEDEDKKGNEKGELFRARNNKRDSNAANDKFAT